jgi:acetyltransferase-like isoleucine patch superfamily enzyme
MSISLQEIREDPSQLVRRSVNKLHSLWLTWTYPFVSIGKNVSVHYSCELIRLFAREISIGNRVTLARDVWLNVACRDVRKEPAIIIEDGCGIGRRSMISARNQIRIGRNTIFGPSVCVIDHNHEYQDVTVPIQHQGISKGGTIRIEEGCWIGFGAAIICTKNELVIGRNSVVGANSVVTRSVPPYSVVAGNPAKIVNQYDPVKKTWMRSVAVGSST